MKRLLLVCLVLQICCNAHSQTMESFVYNEGIELLAKLAHPTNTFKSAKYRVESNSIWVDIYYEGYNTELRINRSGDFFTGVEVIYDNDFVNPFSAVGLLKDLVVDYINDNSDVKTKNDFERLINKAISNMNGQDVACLIFTLAWFDY